MKLSDLCSPVFSEFFERTFGPVNLSESKATCHDCLCAKPERGPLPYYEKHLKCCTFQPFLPNYEVGAILSRSEVSATMKQLILEKIRRREYALPMGIFVPVNYQVEFNHRGPTDFGNREDLLCSYYDSLQQQCGIWRHRGSVCTSYFCVSDRGPKGLKQWALLGDYLHVCEMVLAQDCLVSMGLPPESIDAQLEYINCETGTEEELASSSMSAALFSNFWSDWDESIEEFYLSAYRYVSSLGVEGLRSLLAEETADLEEELKQGFAF